MKTFPLDPLRALYAAKTAAACLITYFITLLLHLPAGYWAVITVAVVMQLNTGGVLASSWRRFAGTLWGALAGALMGVAAGGNQWIIDISLFVYIFIFFYLLKHSEGFRTAAFTAIVIMLADSKHPLTVGFERFIEISLGIVMALAVTLFVWPVKARKSLLDATAATIHSCLDFYRILIEDKLNGTCREEERKAYKNTLSAAIKSNEALFDDVKREIGNLSFADEPLFILMAGQKRIYEILLAMDRAVKDEKADGFHLKSIHQVEALASATMEAFRKLEKSLIQGTGPTGFPDLDTPATAFDERLLELRKTQASFLHTIDDVARFLSFTFAMKEMAGELKTLAKALGHLKPGSSR